MMINEWFTGDDGGASASAGCGDPSPLDASEHCMRLLPHVDHHADGKGHEWDTDGRLVRPAPRPVPPATLSAVADVVLGGEPAQAARKIIAKLGKHIGCAPGPDEIRAVMTHLHAQASELAAIAGTPEDRGALVIAAAMASVRVVETRTAQQAAKKVAPSERVRLEAALTAALDAEAVATARLRAI